MNSGPWFEGAEKFKLLFITLVGEILVRREIIPLALRDGHLPDHRIVRIVNEKRKARNIILLFVHEYIYTRG